MNESFYSCRRCGEVNRVSERHTHYLSERKVVRICPRCQHGNILPAPKPERETARVR